jgi:hypothetical protein
MLNALIVEKKGCAVLWQGVTAAKPEDKDKRPKYSVQLGSKLPNGQTLDFFVGHREPLVLAIKEGDILNIEIKARAFNGGLYCDLLKHEIVKPQAASK